MTEAEWLTCDDPESMIDHLRGKASDQKLRLLSAEFCRQCAALDLTSGYRQLDETTLQAVEEISKERRLPEYWSIEPPSDDLPSVLLRQEAFSAVKGVRKALGSFVTNGIFNRDYGRSTFDIEASVEEVTNAINTLTAAQAHLVREIFGNPFRSPVTASVWLTPTVVNLARSAYEDCRLPSGGLDNTSLAVLADALEEAGCDDAAILSHLRSPGLHVRGCWAVDLCLSLE